MGYGNQFRYIQGFSSLNYTDEVGSFLISSDKWIRHHIGHEKTVGRTLTVCPTEMF